LRQHSNPNLRCIYFPFTLYALTDQKNNQQCLVANIDGNEEKNAEISAKFGIQGFPTLKFFPKGDKEHPVEYEGGRSEEDLVDFLNEQCATERAVGGGLNEKVCYIFSLVDFCLFTTRMV